MHAMGRSIEVSIETVKVGDLISVGGHALEVDDIVRTRRIVHFASGDALVLGPRTRLCVIRAA